MAFKMKQEEESMLFPDPRPAFYQVIHSDDPSSLQHMLIPAGDVSKDVPLNNAESAILTVPPSDRPYEITLKKTEEGTYLENGWGKFCQENSVGHYELLMFTYNNIIDAKIYFSVSLFNQNCVRCTGTGANKKKPNVKVKTEEENMSEFPKPKNGGKKADEAKERS